MTLLEVRGARTATEEVARVLGEPGRFVFSISHPCFDVDERSVGSIDRGRDARGVFRGALYRKVAGDRAERRVRIPWDLGPARIVWTTAYHRTLATYRRWLRDAGLAIVPLEEPAPTQETVGESLQGPYRVEIPLHLVAEALAFRRPRPESRRRRRSSSAVARRSAGRGRIDGSGSARRGSRNGS